jgi:hypothetical protein
LIARPDPIIYNSFCINKIDNFDEKKKAYIEENMKEAGF